MLFVCLFFRFPLFQFFLTLGRKTNVGTDRQNRLCVCGREGKEETQLIFLSSFQSCAASLIDFD